MNTTAKSAIGKEPPGKFPPALRGRRRGARRGTTFAAVVTVALAGCAGVAMAGLAEVDAETAGPLPEARVALVIGNETCIDGSPRAVNARNDARTVADAFRRESSAPARSVAPPS